MRKKITKTALDNLVPGQHDAFLWDTEIPVVLTPAGSRVQLLQQDARSGPNADVATFPTVRPIFRTLRGL